MGCRRKGSFLWLLPVNRQSCNRFRLFLAEIPGNPGNGRPLRALRGVRPPQRSVVPGRGGAARIPRRGLKTRMGRGKRELPHPRRRRRRAVGYAEWPVEVPYSCGRRSAPGDGVQNGLRGIPHPRGRRGPAGKVFAPYSGSPVPADHVSARTDICGGIPHPRWGQASDHAPSACAWRQESRIRVRGPVPRASPAVGPRGTPYPRGRHLSPRGYPPLPHAAASPGWLPIRPLGPYDPVRGGGGTVFRPAAPRARQGKKSRNRRMDGVAPCAGRP